VQHWNVKRLDRPAGLCLAAFLARCAGIVIFKMANTTHLRFLAPFLLWLAARAKHNRFVFLLHARMPAVRHVSYRRAQQVVPYAWYWLLVLSLTTGGPIALHNLFTDMRSLQGT
jgi:succinoglycan biosynthesis protein ExoH